MKKTVLFISIVLIALLGSVVMATPNESLLDKNVNALASDSVDPFMKLCDKYCEDSEYYSCVLQNIIQVPITCDYMYPKH